MADVGGTPGTGSSSRRIDTVGNAMPVTVWLHAYLRRDTGGQNKVETRGNTVGECLDDLVRQFPGVRDRLFDERGRLFEFYMVHVNSDSKRIEELDTPVKDGDEIHLIPIIVAG